MPTSFNRLKLIFLGVFVIAVTAMLVYQMFWVWPGKRCEAAGKWWDNSGRVCAQPILISDITGRTIQDKQAEAAAKAALAKPAAPKALAAPAAAAK